ncbi:MAG TPA: AMP-binding protein [Thermoanaerobaculia bacterium]|nr:AMP-binding protein [Thermoanaerobaculia bacterium]
MIDWRSDESHVLLNPRMPQNERRRLESFVSPLPAHVWLSTSGTTGALKLVALSKSALLASAAAVNRRLESTERDVWCCVLPTFHVGGLGILARAFLSGARVVETSWDASAFASMLDITLASLVPAQVVDLVSASLRAPANPRAIVVGGGALSDEIYLEARALGWPLLPSYGMTECCSQIATATLESSDLVLLDHFEARVESDGRLAFRGESLLTGYAGDEGFVDPRVDGWFVTDDRGAIEGRVLRVHGRASEFVKIGGESVDLARLDRILADISSDAAVVAMPDDRLGHAIHLAVASDDGSRIAADFNSRVFPFEHARGVHRVDAIPRTPLGKLRRAELAAQLERR